MLTEFRAHARGIGSKLLMGLLIMTFAIWGVGDMLRKPSSSTVVATVGNMDIYVSEYQQALFKETEKLRQMLGSKLTPEILQSLNIGPQVLQRLVDTRLLTLQSRKLGFSISDEEIANSIRKSPVFVDDKGKFSKLLFEDMLKKAGVTEKAYIQQLRDSLATRLLTGTLISSVSMPKNAATTILAAREEQRNIELYNIPPELVSTTPTASNDQLKDYYNSHISQFAIPEYRTISYIMLSPDDAKKYVKASQAKDADKRNIENIYRDRIDEFKKPERRKIDQLLFGNEEAAVKAYKAIKAGSSFDEVSKGSNILNPNAISLGLVEKSSLMAEAADKVFALTKGEISEPIKSSFGWHIFLVKDIIPISTLSLEEVRPQLEKELQQQAEENALTDLSNKIEDYIAGGGTLSEAAKEFELKLIPLPPVDKSGAVADGSIEKNLPKDDKFLEIAFKTDAKTESPMINGKSGINYMLRVESVTAESVRPLEDVKAKVSEAWAQQEKKKQLLEMAQKISDAFVNPADRAAAIAKYSLPAPVLLTVSQKQEDNKKLPAKVMSDIFTREVGYSSPEFEQANGGYAIAVLKGIIPAKYNATDPKYISKLAEIETEYKSSMQNEIIEQYLRFLASKFSISVNSAAMKVNLGNGSEE